MPPGRYGLVAAGVVVPTGRVPMGEAVGAGVYGAIAGMAATGWTEVIGVPVDVFNPAGIAVLRASTLE